MKQYYYLVIVYVACLFTLGVICRYQFSFPPGDDDESRSSHSFLLKRNGLLLLHDLQTAREYLQSDIFSDQIRIKHTISEDNVKSMMNFLKLQNSYVRSSFSFMKPNLIHLLYPETYKEFAEALKIAQTSIVSNFSSSFLSSLKPEIKYSIVLSFRDSNSEVMQSMISWASNFTNTPVILIIPLKLYPESYVQKLIVESNIWPNVLLVNWPNLPYDEHHSFRVFSSYFLFTPYALHINTDVSLTNKAKFENAIEKMIQIFSTQNEILFNLNTFEQPKGFPNGGKHAEVIKKPTLERYPVPNIHSNDSFFYTLRWGFGSTTHQSVSTQIRNMYVEDHAIFMHSFLTKALYDPSVSVTQEMYTLSLSHYFVSGRDCLHESAEEYLRYELGTSKFLEPIDIVYAMNRRSNEDLFAQTMLSVAGKFGFNPLFRNSYRNYLERALVDSKINFTNSNHWSWVVHKNESKRIKISVVFGLFALAGYNRLWIDRKPWRLDDVYNLITLGELEYILNSSLLRVTTDTWNLSLSLKSIHENVIKPSMKEMHYQHWFPRLISSSDHIENVHNQQAFKMSSQSLPNFVRTSASCPTIIRFYFSKTLNVVQPIREWFTKYVSSAIFDDAQSDREEHWVWWRYSYRYRYQHDTNRISSNGCIGNGVQLTGFKYTFVERNPCNLDDLSSIHEFISSNTTLNQGFQMDTLLENHPIQEFLKISYFQYAPCPPAFMKLLLQKIKSI